MRTLPAVLFLFATVFSSAALSAPPSAKPEPASPDCRDMPVAAQPGLETATTHKKTGNGRGTEVVAAKLARCASGTDPGQDPLAGLPPDPGEAGKATLEGIDSDGDGVRDDVQRWIVMTYPDDRNKQMALFQVARVHRMSLVADITREEAQHQYVQSEKADLCVKRVFGGGYLRHVIEVSSRMLNTYERTMSEHAFMKRLNGSVIEGVDRATNHCEFEIVSQ